MEKRAIRALKKESVAEDSTSSIGNTFGMTMSERLAKRRKLAQQSDTYINSDFVLGSAAQVECLFSFAKHVIPGKRSRMTPQLFEAICFLKANHDCWDVFLFEKAAHCTRDSRA